MKEDHLEATARIPKVALALFGAAIFLAFWLWVEGIAAACRLWIRPSLEFRLIVLWAVLLVPLTIVSFYSASGLLPFGFLIGFLFPLIAYADWKRRRRMAFDAPDAV